MLKIRQFEARTLSWWYGQRNEIDMAPAYQRKGGLWSPRDKAFLIDSILNGFDIPKLYVADFSYGDSPLNQGRRSYAVIDGKQRLEAIFGFFAGEVVLERDFEYALDPSLRLGGLSYADLRQNFPEVASLFENFNLSVMSVFTDDARSIHELFVRLNSSKPLTGAEIRNAMPGVVPELLRDLSAHEFFSKCVRFKTNRGQDLNVAAKLLLFEFRGRLVDTKKVNLDRLAEAGARAEAPESEFTRAAEGSRAVLNDMAEVFTRKDQLLKSQGQVGVYYWLVRGHRDKLGKVRPFLVSFERARRVNRQRARDEERVHEVDRDLLRYDSLSRSINDQGSLEGLFEILSAWFDEYCGSGVEPDRRIQRN